jgi:hypothetical protein
MFKICNLAKVLKKAQRLDGTTVQGQNKKFVSVISLYAIAPLRPYAFFLSLR